jgi:hypothetical protein
MTDRLLTVLGGLARTIRPLAPRAHAAASASNVTLLPRLRPYDQESETA